MVLRPAGAIFKILCTPAGRALRAGKPNTNKTDISHYTFFSSEVKRVKLGKKKEPGAPSVRRVPKADPVRILMGAALGSAGFPAARGRRVRVIRGAKAECGADDGQDGGSIHRIRRVGFLVFW